MPISRTIWLASSLWAGLALHFVQSENASSFEINWRKDYYAARMEARSAGKPLFVVFR